MRSWKDMSRGLRAAIVATVVAALVLAGLYVTYRIQTATDDDAPLRTASQGRDDAPGEKALDLGTSAQVGSDYRVTVDELTSYEGSRLRFLAATVTATYLGTGQRDPVDDLIVEIASSSDSRTFGGSACPMEFDEASDRTLLAFDDVGTQVICFDLSANELANRTVSVAAASAPGDAVHWSTKGTVTKELPSADTAAPAAGGAGAQSPAARPPARGNTNNDDACDDFDEDEFEEYKQWGEDLERQVDANRGSYDEDDLDEYEEWREGYEKQIEFFEKWEAMC